MIAFKTILLINEWNYVASSKYRSLIEIATDIHVKYGNILITEILRTRSQQVEIYKKHLKTNTNNIPYSVHEFWRGMDIIPIENESMGQTIVDHINYLYIYDYKRSDIMVALWHQVVGRKHIHLQIHKRTQKRET